MSDNGVALGRAFAAERNATDWRAYARKLEQQLLAAEANLAGNKALKDAALRELAKADPANYLMVQQNRQRIYDKDFDAVIASGRRPV
ncbi:MULTISPECIES: hypothetical protein [Paraburkholderia]|jgi:hypothetical protein|uniref:Uncharacterized protein n=1 Tax=Paraburkholderia fynbosensis TaxID=1200993 RepID=A0A6J5G2M2_9BURK|nr:MULTISPECIES: hypothetical protein [Paraburkholderia]MDH6149702.1 hypothetical protein [Paraburkholderia sp. WSM4179]CAB3789834.1 hypothetical protein LMG27177_02659 [Paraburkholderia fynbosensis]